MATVHIIGAGISGLAAATWLAEKQVPVKLYEASAHAGGRCRSSHHSKLGTIDYGLHIISTADGELHHYLKRINAPPFTPAHALPLPRAPLADYLPWLGWLARPRGMAETRIAAESQLRDAWFTPLTRTLFATLPQHLPARALRSQWRRLVRRRVSVAQASLQESFIQPALDYLEYHGSSVYFGHALTRLERQGDRLQALAFGRKKLLLAPDDVVILATPPQFTRTLLPQLPEHSWHSAITLHFKCSHREPDGLHYPINAPMDLLRYRAGMISAALRIADHAWQGDQGFLAERIWKDIRQRHQYLTNKLPVYATWREKRAGHRVQEAPAIAPDQGAIILAGDWLDPRQPSSLEAAAASGHAAAERAMTRLPARPQPVQQPARFD